MKKRKIILSYLLMAGILFSHSMPVFAVESDGRKDIQEEAHEELGIPMINVLESEEAEYAEEARHALEKLVAEEDVYALVYLCEKYQMKKTPEKNGATVISMATGTTVQIKGVFIQPDGTVWYQVTCDYKDVVYKGYVEKKYLAYSNAEFLKWEKDYIAKYDKGISPVAVNYADVQSFPTSYQSQLMTLKQAHPNWIFVKQNTNLDWQTVIDNEMKGDRSLISSSKGAAYRGEYYGQGWYYASEDAVKYYMDPRNFLDDTRVFQFEQLTYNATYHTQAAVQSILNSTFMSGAIPGEGKGYAQAFYEIGTILGVSPFHLASRVYQEQGKGTSALISGNYEGYEGYYNYFNVSAAGKTDKEVVESGLKYAQSMGWNTRYASLKGGAEILSANYILKGQDTLYLQKFDVDATHNGLYAHQYMQNIMAPYTEAPKIKTAYTATGALENPFVFKIPVYNNMPSEACPLPENVVKSTPTPTVAPTSTPSATPTATPTLTPSATPTVTPGAASTATPTATPTAKPSASPTLTPSEKPTVSPDAKATRAPSATPTATPEDTPSASPTVKPTTQPTQAPKATATVQPTAMPTVKPTIQPTQAPTVKPTTQPTVTPTVRATEQPTQAPTTKPTEQPGTAPTATVQPTATPTVKPTIQPTQAPTAQPTTQPTASPAVKPTTVPTAKPTEAPVSEPENESGGNDPQLPIEILPQPSQTEQPSEENQAETVAEKPMPTAAPQQQMPAPALEPVNEKTGKNNELTLDMSEHSTIYAGTLETIREEKRNVVLSMSDNIQWRIDGNSFRDGELTDVNLNVTMGSSRIPTRKLHQLVRDDEKWLELSLSHDGDFGFDATLTLTVLDAIPGQYANLFYYNETAKAFEYICASRVSEECKISFLFKHASDYVIIFGESSMENVLEERMQNIQEPESYQNMIVEDSEELPAEEPKKAAGIIGLIILGSIAVVIGVILVVNGRKREEE